MFVKALLSLLLVSSVLTQQDPFGDLLNVNVVRTINLLELQKIRETIGVVIQNTGNKSIDKYYFALDQPKNHTLAHLSAQTKADKQVLSVKRDQVDTGRQLQFYSVGIPSLRAGGKLVISIKLFLLRHFIPYPASITQVQVPSFLFSDNAYLFSPYPTTSVKTHIKLVASQGLDYSKEPSPVEQGKEMITYGPYSDIPAFSDARIKLTFPYTKGVLYAHTLVREIELSHWGNNLGVEESYDVGNFGPRFEGAFSRAIHFALERYGSSSFVKSFDFDLPPGAADAYFRDEIGNVSTSKFRGGRTESHLHVEPRFPIYGGWHYNWNHGYNLPLSAFLRVKASDPTKYTLKVPFLNSLPNVPILNFTFKAVLPDGARDVKVTSLPVDGFTRREGVLFTYLDLIGRPVVLIHKENVIKQHWVDIEITYTYDPQNLLLKPLGVFGAFMLCFVSTMVVSRLNLHLGSSKFTKQK